MMGKECDEMMYGLALAVKMCRENEDGCRSCRFHGTYTGCMFRSKAYPARWQLEKGRILECGSMGAEK